MSRLQILPGDDLTTIAFKVCTALDSGGYRAVLTGGSAATAYAPEAYQSADLDYIANFAYFKEEFDAILNEIGYSRRTLRVYACPVTPLTLEFPNDENMIGSDYVKDFATLERDGMKLYILTPTDCVRDRLCSYFWFNSVSALGAAVAVARFQEVDLEFVRIWAEREGEIQKCGDFLRRLDLP